MYRQPCRGILRLCRDVNSAEIRFVDILEVSFRQRKLPAKFVCPMPCKLFVLFIPQSTSLLVRWCTWRSSVLAAGLDHVQRWKYVSEHCSLQTLKWEPYAYIFWRMFSFKRTSFKRLLMEISICKSFPEVVFGRWFAMWQIDSSCVSVCTENVSHLTLNLLEVFARRWMPKKLSILTTISSFVCETRKTMFFSRWTVPCLSGVLSFCWIVSFNRASQSISFAFPFLRPVMFARAFPPFEYQPFDIQDRQSLPCSSAPFKKVYPAAPVSWSLFLKNQHVLLLQLEDVVNPSPRSLVDSWLLFQIKVLLI